MLKEAFEEWKAHPVTIAVFKEVTELKKALQKDMGEGATLCDTADGTQKSTAEAVGQIKGLNQLLNISCDEEREEETEE